MAAPTDWEGLSLFASVEEPANVAKLGFEIPGESFPGSAFYYLADGAKAGHESTKPGEWSLKDDSAKESANFADSMIAGGTNLDLSRALQCLTMAVYYEAASEPEAGQRAVAQVVLNRVAHPDYPDTVCGVVFQGSERQSGCQFTFTCDGSLARQPSAAFWSRSRRVAQAALAGSVYRPAGLATHYHTIQVHPYWADSLELLGAIGTHQFYRLAGKAGKKSIFRFSYGGREPMAAPHARLETLQRQAASDSASLPPKAPIPVMRAADDSLGAMSDQLDERLVQSGNVRPEFAHSGQWIGKP